MQPLAPNNADKAYLFAFLSWAAHTAGYVDTSRELNISDVAFIRLSAGKPIADDFDLVISFVAEMNEKSNREAFNSVEVSSNL